MEGRVEERGDNYVNQIVDEESKPTAPLSRVQLYSILKNILYMCKVDNL